MRVMDRIRKVTTIAIAKVIERIDQVMMVAIAKSQMSQIEKRRMRCQ